MLTERLHHSIDAAHKITDSLCEYQSPMRDWKFVTLVAFHQKAAAVFQLFDAHRPHFMQYPSESTQCALLSDLRIHSPSDLQMLWFTVYRIVLSTSLIYSIVDHQSPSNPPAPDSLEPHNAPMGYFYHATFRHWERTSKRAETFLQTHTVEQCATAPNIEGVTPIYIFYLTDKLRRCWWVYERQTKLSHSQQLKNAQKVIVAATSDALKDVISKEVILQAILTSILFGEQAESILQIFNRIQTAKIHMRQDHGIKPKLLTRVKSATGKWLRSLFKHEVGFIRHPDSLQHMSFVLSGNRKTRRIIHDAHLRDYIYT